MSNYDLIDDKDGVDVVINAGEVKVKLDFNFAKIKLREVDDRGRRWDFKLMSGYQTMGRVTFSAYQFMADGVERRTIALEFLELEPRFRGQGMSYEVAKFIVNTVTQECDQAWGQINSKPVLFVEKKDIKKTKNKTAAQFIRKIGKKVLGINDDEDDQVIDGDEMATVIGEDISLQLIEGHLIRSNPA